MQASGASHAKAARTLCLFTAPAAASSQLSLCPKSRILEEMPGLLMAVMAYLYEKHLYKYRIKINQLGQGKKDVKAEMNQAEHVTCIMKI